MITTPEEYFANLYRIQDTNPPAIALLLPSDEKIYNVDLDTRTIDAPSFLSVETDHKAEVIYFKVDRFFDYMDLSETVCVIQYVNGAGEGHFYRVPFCDITTLAEEDKILFPWCIDGAATKAAGTVKYSIRFFKINETGSHFIYNINTLPASSDVLHGMPDQFNPEDYEFATSQFDQIMSAINRIETAYAAGLVWIDV